MSPEVIPSVDIGTYNRIMFVNETLEESYWSKIAQLYVDQYKVDLMELRRGPRQVVEIPGPYEPDGDLASREITEKRINGINQTVTLVAKNDWAIKDYEYAKNNGHVETVGSMLGYPTCCAEVFAEHWSNGVVNPVYESARDGVFSEKKDRHLQAENEHFPVLSEWGLSSVRHLPCEMGQCAQTDTVVERRESFLDEVNSESLDFLDEMTDLPTRWDAKKGIAIIKTPIFKAQTNGPAYNPSVIVDCDGSHYPDEAPTGLTFPWKRETTDFETPMPEVG